MRNTMVQAEKLLTQNPSLKLVRIVQECDACTSRAHIEREDGFRLCCPCYVELV